MISKLRRKGERFIESVAIGVVVDDLNKFIVCWFLFLSVVAPATARGLKEGKKNPRESAFFTLPWIQTFLTGSVLSETAQICQVRQRLTPWWPDIVCPLQSKADTQPQLQSAC